MYCYLGNLMTLSKDRNENVFDKAVIDKILNDQPNVPVRINSTGDSIGRTTHFYLNEEKDRLMVEIDINIPNLEQLFIYIVPGGHIKLSDLITESDGSRRVTKFNLSEVSITSLPADVKLTPMTRRGDLDVSA